MFSNCFKDELKKFKNIIFAVELISSSIIFNFIFFHWLKMNFSLSINKIDDFYAINASKLPPITFLFGLSNILEQISLTKRTVKLLVFMICLFLYEYFRLSL